MSAFGQSSRPTASLSSGLLARKGQARPAMRPQGYVGLTPSAADDLGWNDMGHDAPAAADPVAVTPPAAQPGVPPVLRQRETLVAQLTEAMVEVPAPAVQPQPVEPAPAPAPTPRNVSLATAERLRRETTRKPSTPKAAFTLRLDADRHLRLRLASAIHRDSAQHLVTQALDAFLNEIPEIDALASQLPQRAGSKTRGK